MKKAIGGRRPKSANVSQYPSERKTVRVPKLGKAISSPKASFPRAPRKRAK